MYCNIQGCEMLKSSFRRKDKKRQSPSQQLLLHRLAWLSLSAWAPLNLEFNKSVIVSHLNCVLVKSFQENFIKSFQENFSQIAHGRVAGTPFLITFLWWWLLLNESWSRGSNIEVPCQFAILQFKVTLFPWIITDTHRGSTFPNVFGCKWSDVVYYSMLKIQVINVMLLVSRQDFFSKLIHSLKAWNVTTLETLLSNLR
jgi:hypothetical protein